LSIREKFIFSFEIALNGIENIPEKNVGIEKDWIFLFHEFEKNFLVRS
jgi:hypothetical protein